ncbi:type II toxin-antitoxin system VapC family toxin [Rickettsia tamurae]|uniref:type II toxin-antitoxin system VapC family toxin n=1 Tax=Rickettsia tamurae TaxID=334545 RepID=UPI00050A23FC|nr:type II toxin-antitoxin system VapC family toxin [Rickettsia tamurae]
MSNRVVLDTSALLALLQNEPGSTIVKPLIQFSCMSTVNITEVLTSLQRMKITMDTAYTLVTEIIPSIIPFDLEQAAHTAQLQPYTQPKGLSLGDRACITLGIKLQVPIYTVDKIWAELKLNNADIKLIR